MSFLDRFLVDVLGLSKAPKFLWIFYLSVIGFTLVHLVLSPWLSPLVAPQSYAALKGRRARNNWAIHVVSQVHAAIIVPFSFYIILTEGPDIKNDPAFGWDDKIGTAFAISCGYFAWDTLDAIYNFVDIGFVIHGVACFFVFSMGFRPFVAYYGIRCLLWEISTIFLNIHWFLDKTNRTGSQFQLINGGLLLSSFFSVRMVWGGYVSCRFFVTLSGCWRQIPMTYVIVIGAANFALQGLNWLWFSKMITALRSRFAAPSEREQLIPSHNGAVAPN